VQPVATCRQSPYLHKPAIVKLLLLIYSFQFRYAFCATTAPSQPHPFPSPTHSLFICGVNSSINASISVLVLNR